MQMSDAISEILKRTFFLRIELQIATKFFAIHHLNSVTFKLFGFRVSWKVDQSLLDLWQKLQFRLQRPPTSTVSTSTNSTSTNFIAIDIKFVLVELLCSKIRTSGNWLCSTH